MYYHIIILILIFLQTIYAADDYCSSVEDSGATDCYSCVEITFLGGRPNCAYCANPYTGMTHCQKPFYPPSINTPGFTVYACYNDSGSGLDIFRYKPRCSESDCYIDQCLVSGKILWYYIVPGVIGFCIILILGCIYSIRCWKKNQANKWIEQDAKQDAKLKQKANKRQKERETKRQELKNKYIDNMIEDDYL